MEIVIVGAGDIGFHLIKKLSAEKHNITVIDSDPKKVQYAHANLDAIVLDGSGTDKQVLEKANIHKADIVAALTNNDEINIITCQIAKKIGVPTTILRIRNHSYFSENYFLNKKELGADFIIQPELLTANAVVRLVRQANATDILEFEDGKIQLVGIRIDKHSPILYTALKDLSNRIGKPPFRILAINRKQKTIIPGGNDQIIEGDQVYIICERENIQNALSYFGKSSYNVNENIMIIGGGLVGEFIAKQLENDFNTKIIEGNKTKSDHLAESLKNTLVINGDGSDLDLITFEGLSDMDELIAVSGDDETNIITSLVALHLKVPRTITLVRKLEYFSLTHAIGLDSLISKQMITVNAIKQIIERSRFALFAEIPGVEAEIIEFIANRKSKIIKKSLKNTKFPPNAIVGAVFKNNHIIEIPTGDTHIQAGDKVIVFSLPTVINDVAKLF